MTTVSVKGMTCAGCEDVVETAVELLDGVEEATADRYEETVQVSGDVSVEMVADKVELAGYTALGEATVSDDPDEGSASHDDEDVVDTDDVDEGDESDEDDDEGDSLDDEDDLEE